MGVVAVERRHAGSYGFVWVGGVLAGLVAVALLRGRSWPSERRLRAVGGADPRSRG